MEEHAFDPAEHLAGDAFGTRKRSTGAASNSTPRSSWTARGTFAGGLNTHANSWRELYNFAFTLDTEKLFAPSWRDDLRRLSDPARR